MVGNFFEKRRSVASGIAVSGSGLGTFIFAPIVQCLLESVGYRKTLLVLGGIELILCICGATYIPSRIPVRRTERQDVADIELADIGSGSVLNINNSIIDVPVGKAKPSEMSAVLLQAALCSRSIGSTLSFHGKSRSHVTDTQSVMDSDDRSGGARTPLPQPSVDGSVLAQAALCLSRLSPSISSAQSSTSKLSDMNAVTPVMSESPITSAAGGTNTGGIPEELIENVELALDNDETLVQRRYNNKPEFPPIPEEFINPFSGSVHALHNAKDSMSGFTVTKVPSAEDACSRTESESHACANAKEYIKSTDETPAVQPCDVDISIFPGIRINGKQVVSSEEASDNLMMGNIDLTTCSSSSICPKSSGDSVIQPRNCWEPLITISRIFKIRFFVLFCLSNLLVCIGYQLPYMYFKAFALSLGLGDDAWAVILAVMGVMDTLGRVLIGFCFDYVKTDAGRLLGFAASMVIAGIVLCFTSLAGSYVSLLCFAAGFALVAGSTDSLVAALLVGFVGLDTLGYSFGMSIEMQGIGFVIGPPIAGNYYTYSGCISFMMSGFL